MNNPETTTPALSKKVGTFVSDKIFDTNQADSLIYLVNVYYEMCVAGSPQKTQNAKFNDLSKFITFFSQEVGHEHIDHWTPSVTKHFQTMLLTVPSSHTGKNYKATSVNRIMATIRHFSRWLMKHRPPLAGNPFHGVRDVSTDDPDWNGLTNRQIMRLKAACEQRDKACTRKNQNPLLETAVLYVLLYTGLREHELVSLNIKDYHHRGFHDVARKGQKVTRKVPVPQEARDKLDAYLATRDIGEGSEPLFLSRYGNRLLTRDVQRICQRLSAQSSALVPEEEKFHLAPHMLRHTFLKRIADKEGIHVAQKMSGNVSIREIFRYTKPSDQEMEEIAESVF